ncbi:PREDICTED: pentatricopeptide repeat-containing protein At1g06710, mitochondrial [Tarenaya hassleriana]|uniref:pentatricopeptide repeat-containing protein At1g06710, mitochondrial n=1 Tax=Tarenaya hassleriana TaxID=28532 RepID=UPI00053C31B2|nr:PREDICTED: pentatricopeptide repeat-containing protein At1g06710, mitochondrial [Tarenaya hassleriana]XP_010557158.1 PREDICTED: pentatricopeptide repeat-containing protein At1g06710, mitochondrial [Tarenaya hassleriana]
MKKRLVRYLLSRSCPHFPPKSSHRCSLVNRISSRSRNFSPRFLSTSPPDELHGLVDPDDPFSPIKSQEEVDFSKEFSFLRDSLVDSDHSDDSQRVPRVEVSQCSVDALSIANAVSSEEDVFGSKTQKFLRQFREKLSESLVIEVLHLIKRPSAIVSFFIWAGRQIGYKHTVPVYHALVEAIVRDNDEKVPEVLLQQIRDDDREVLGKILNILIQKHCRNGLFNAALEELGRLKDCGYRPSRSTYNCLIQAFLKADRLDSATLVLREMSLANLRMDGFTLRCFAYSLCKAGKWREALTLIETEDFVPDTLFYTKLISGLCEASLFEEAMEFLNRMRANSCVPNVVTYSTLLCGCLNKRQLGRCKRILNTMIMEGCYPSPKIFYSLVHAYCRSGDYSYAYKLLKKMIQCGYKPGYVVYNILIGNICGNQDLPSSDLLELAEKAYSEMLAGGVVLNKINVSNFARCLCGAGKFEKAFNVICEMMGKGFVPDTSTYSKVIGYLCNASKVEMAFLLFEEMKRSGIVPDVYTYTILIDSFAKAGLIEQASKWFDEMRKVGCPPNLVTYTALIHSYLKAKKVTDANKLFEMLLSDGFVPNIITYTALIDGHCKAGQSEKACQILEKMCGSRDVRDVDMYFKQNDGNSERPNVVTYGALVDGLCKAHKVKEAWELLDAMAMEGCEPNQVVYDALIDGFCKVGKLEEAQEVFTKMSEHGYTASVYTFSSLIGRLFEEKRLDLVLKVLSRMLENSCAPNVVIYTEMIDGLCKVGKTDEAYKLMQMMEEKGCQANVVTYTAMIDGFGKMGKIDRCLELLEQMGSKGVAPNFITYRVLIDHCCRNGLLDMAHSFLEEMKQTHWPVHVASYRKVIEGFNKDFISSLGLLDEIAKDDAAPVISVYTVLIDNFVKAKRLEVALTLHEEVASFSPTLAGYGSTYNALIEGLCLANEVDKAFQLFSEMTKKGVIPELQTLSNLIKGLFWDKKVNEALLLLDSISQMDVHWTEAKKT